MCTLHDVSRLHSDLSEADIDWLHLLVAEWTLLADLSFADLIYFYQQWRGARQPMRVALKNAQKWLQKATRE